MSNWTSSSYAKRLTYELRDTTPKGRARLQATMKDIEFHMQSTGYDKEGIEEWILLLRAYEKATELLSLYGQTVGQNNGGLMYSATGRLSI